MFSELGLRVFFYSIACPEHTMRISLDDNVIVARLLAHLTAAAIGSFNVPTCAVIPAEYYYYLKKEICYAFGTLIPIRQQ